MVIDKRTGENKTKKIGDDNLQIYNYPALLVELKWNKTAQTALKQIKEKNYPESLFKYSGKILLIGISYDKKTKEHPCVIEEI